MGLTESARATNMNRGMLSLSHAEIATLLAQVARVTEVSALPTELLPRLIAAQAEFGDPVAIELSEESAESLLDFLPPPTSEPADLSPLREKLREKGQFWTPPWVADAMVSYVLDDTKLIFDPAGGRGAFLEALRRIKNKKTSGA